MAAEICGPRPAVDTSGGFNEAAANGRGNSPRPERAARGVHGFNEAAANGRGNGARHGRQRDQPSASMRPRRMAAEMLRASFHDIEPERLQ